MQYLRARYYDTESGRFSVADTYLGNVSKPLTLNRYTYTVNNPVMQVDPSGHIAGWIVIGVVGVIIIGGALLFTGCGADETDKESETSNSETPRDPKEKAEQAVEEMLPDIEEVNLIDEELKDYISGNKQVEKGKSLADLISELNERRAKLCEDLEERKKIVEEYNNSNPDKTIEIPELPNLEESSSQLVTKEQISHFLAQCYHEGRLGLTERNWSKENWRDDEYQIDKAYFNEKYSDRVDLGNLGGDDGYLYRGAGYIQLTGRYNYQQFANYVGDDEIMVQGADYVAENYAWEAAAYFGLKRI